MIDARRPGLGQRPAAILAACLPALAGLLGCGGPPSGTVSGRVTFEGEAVALGTIAFHGANGRVASASISAGGYQVEKVPIGPATVTVQAHPPMTAMLPPPFENAPPESLQPQQLRAARPTFVPLPPQYAAKGTSGLTYMVHDGGQTHDVILPP